MTTESSIATQIHGRYLAHLRQGAPVLVGFHGYGESAETQLARLAAIPGSDRWSLISIQGLHRFYDRRNDAVVASWMTRQDRELAIADNLAYVSRVFDTLLPDRSAIQAMVFAGFSQGVAMAFRAAVTAHAPQRHVMAVGGDVPPEITHASLGGLASVLLYRGDGDPWYTAEAFALDGRRLQEAGTRLQAVSGPGTHEWSRDVIDRAARYLDELVAGLR